MTDEKPLPALPEYIIPCVPAWNYSGPGSMPQHVEAHMREDSEHGKWYHEDAYLAVLARLRMAVEALQKIADIADSADEDEADDALTDVAGEVMCASLRIGPLPPTTEKA